LLPSLPTNRLLVFAGIVETMAHIVEWVVVKPLTVRVRRRIKVR
jgi:hypothetical protein